MVQNEYLKIEGDHADRRHGIELEMAHLRDSASGKDQLIHEQRFKMADMQKCIEEQGL